MSAILVCSSAAVSAQEQTALPAICKQINALGAQVVQGTLHRPETFEDELFKGNSVQVVSQEGYQANDWLVTSTYTDESSPLVFKMALKNKLNKCFGMHGMFGSSTYIWMLPNKAFLTLYNEQNKLYLRVAKNSLKEHYDVVSKERLDYTPKRK